MGTRKTAAERREAEFNAQMNADVRFVRGIRTLSSRKEAWDFVEYGPRDGTPGGVLYTSLGYYLRNGMSPEGASQWEKDLHAELGKRLSANPAKGPPAK